MRSNSCSCTITLATSQLDGAIYFFLNAIINVYLAGRLLRDSRPIEFKSERDAQLWRGLYRRGGMSRIDMLYVLPAKIRTVSNLSFFFFSFFVGCKKLLSFSGLGFSGGAQKPRNGSAYFKTGATLFVLKFSASL
jgi:hypothetical protein